MNKTDRDASIPRNVQLYVEDDSGQLIALKSDLSGQLAIDVTVGDIVAVVSGDITATMYSGEIHVVSGSVTLGSGGNRVGTVGVTSGLVSIQSGSVSVQSGEVHVVSGEIVGKVSGETITVASGAWLKSGLEIIWRGVQVSGTVAVSGTVITPITSGSVIVSGAVQVSGTVQISGLVGIHSGLVGILSGNVGAQVSGAVQVSGSVIVSGIVGVSGAVQILSGSVSISSGSIGAQVSGAVIISGTVTTKKDATRYIIFSGYATTDLLVYSGINFTQGEKVIIGLTCLTQGSGARYTVRGDILSGVLRYSMTSGSFTSGQVIVETITDPYEWIDVGIASLQSAFTGTVTVGVVVK